MPSGRALPKEAGGARSRGVTTATSAMPGNESRTVEVFR